MPARARSTPASAAPPDNPAADPVRQRILRQARADFFAHGYSAFTMDALAAELGLSKKTLYVHFHGKDEIIAAVIDHLAAEIRAAANALLADRSLGFAEKLRGFVETLVERMAALSPRTVRDLQRYAPHLHAKIENVRGETLPYVFGRFVEEGQIEGLVRTDQPPGFAIEFFLQAMQGLMQPASLERLGLVPRDVVAAGIDQFFGGLLTTAGRKHYEKLFPR
jgi:AcrR family transcriptional regulator